MESVSSNPVDSLAVVKSSHLATFNSKPREEERHRMVLKSAKPSSVVPPNVPSSKYHTLRGDDKELVRDIIDKLNSAGPNGSPCWTPAADCRMVSPKNNSDGAL